MADLFILSSGRGFTPHSGPYAIVDLETTGFAGTDRIVEISIIRMTLDGTIHEEFTTLVNPGRDVGPTHVHGITAEDVEEAPTFDEIADAVRHHLTGAIVVAHNLSFEDRFLRDEFARAGVDLPVGLGLCTLKLAQSALNLKPAKLSDVTAHYNFEVENAHSAQGDVIAVARFLPAMLEVGAPRWTHPMSERTAPAHARTVSRSAPAPRSVTLPS